MSSKKTIYLIRHGQTDFNRKGIIQGSGVDTDLNETGRRQAELFFEAYKNVPFDKVYTSSMKRTHQSVQQFLEKSFPHEAYAELDEISWGIFEGVQSNPKWHSEYLRVVGDWRKGILETRIPKGENPLELQARQEIGLQKIMANTHEETILICMHGRAMKSFLCLMLNRPLTDMDEFQHQNLCLYKLKYEQHKFELLKANSTEHLAEFNES